MPLKKECRTCEHKDLDGDKEPCNSCIRLGAADPHDNWKKHKDYEVIIKDLE